MTRRGVNFTPEAEEQLAALYRYIAENANADVALRYASDRRPEANNAVVHTSHGQHIATLGSTVADLAGTECLDSGHVRTHA